MYFFVNAIIKVLDGRPGSRPSPDKAYNSGIAIILMRFSLKFDCNAQALLDRCARPLIDFYAYPNHIQFRISFFSQLR